MRIPNEFKKRFQKLMEPWEYDEFISALSGDRVTGIRINRLKINLSEWCPMSPFKIEPVPWADGGYYFDEKERPGIHPYYHAGYKDWFIEEYTRPGYTIEAGLGRNPLPISQFDMIYNNNEEIMLLAPII
jgi:hypothetical protein